MHLPNKSWIFWEVGAMFKTKIVRLWKYPTLYKFAHLNIPQLLLHNSKINTCFSQSHLNSWYNQVPPNETFLQSLFHIRALGSDQLPVTLCPALQSLSVCMGKGNSPILGHTQQKFSFFKLELKGMRNANSLSLQVGQNLIGNLAERALPSWSNLLSLEFPLN